MLSNTISSTTWSLRARTSCKASCFLRRLDSSARAMTVCKLSLRAPSASITSFFTGAQSRCWSHIYSLPRTRREKKLHCQLLLCLLSSHLALRMRSSKSSKMRSLKWPIGMATTNTTFSWSIRAEVWVELVFKKPRMLWWFSYAVCLLTAASQFAVLAQGLRGWSRRKEKTSFLTTKKIRTKHWLRLLASKLIMAAQISWRLLRQLKKWSLCLKKRMKTR